MLILLKVISILIFIASTSSLIGFINILSKDRVDADQMWPVLILISMGILISTECFIYIFLK